MLFDQNLSPRLADRLASQFPGSEHVRSVGLERADDSEVWNFAKEHGFVIASKDEDFHQLAFLFGPPPKVVWVRTGNCSAAEVERLLIESIERLTQFEEDPEAAFLVL